MDIEKIRAKLEIDEPIAENGFRHYSILIPMITGAGEGDIDLLYEVRSRNLDRQPGEICFPGGQVEEGETYAECALRETEEEVGIKASHIDLMPELTTVYGVGKFAMHCFPGFLDTKARDIISLSDEVERVFTVSLKKLMSEEVEMYYASLIQEGPEEFPYERVTGGDSYPWSRLKSPVPVYDLGEHVIWGLTGRVTKVLVETLKEGRK